ncbi:CrcB family protein [Herbiconiux sp. CPCC 205763]|uniref:Fluoride-specific ion channel FluC n=1 Tax=Herbiconiux aconitum TaxID=2970913 RepID=A0ABT2GRA5_9MICO|nr:CrcB family protein [Herbiconiux aconitum]MCS5718751.1 CrcB family protein [Herbiconiux aconitum]
MSEAKYIPLVALGGALGTLARYGLSTVIPNAGALPVNVVVINLSGALLLGWLLEALKLGGPDTGSRKAARLGLGTGLLGGYTTYSMFVVDETGLIDTGNFVGSLVYALPTVALGVLAALLGAATARALHRARMTGDSS